MFWPFPYKTQPCPWPGLGSKLKSHQTDRSTTKCMQNHDDNDDEPARSNRIRIESKEMCETTDSSFQSSNTLNNTGVWSLIELASLFTVPLSAVNGLSRLTTSNGQARPIRKFSNRPMTFDRIESRSFAGPEWRLRSMNIISDTQKPGSSSSSSSSSTERWRPASVYYFPLNRCRCINDCVTHLTGQAGSGSKPMRRATNY